MNRTESDVFEESSESQHSPTKQRQQPDGLSDNEDLFSGIIL